MPKPTIRTILAACATLAVVAGAADASASWWRHFSPSMCVPLAGYAGPLMNSYGQAYNSGGATAHWSCPIVDDSNFRVTGGGVGAQVWGYQNAANSVTISDCDTYYNGPLATGYGCGEDFASGGAHAGTFSIGLVTSSTSAWYAANDADSKWILMEVTGPVESGGSTSYNTIFGYGYSH